MKWDLEGIRNESQKFDESALFYDKYRPSYPKELIDSIISISGIREDAKILEIGAGSGKATELFVNRGYNLTCIELGEKLAQKGIEKFKDTGQVEYIVGRFEEVDGLDKDYDLAISAQAFHWVQKPLGYKKIADALRPNSYCALFWNKYINDESPISNELAEICKEYGVLYMLKYKELLEASQREKAEIEESSYFKNIRFLEYPWQQEQTLEDFINFLNTGNGYIGMKEERKNELKEKLSNMFAKNEDKITRNFNCILYIFQNI
ncbi:class I SAM-dependent methyltransferase [Lutispora sp.]|uniref:class I SAM-dependent methyltransferase n=1 Tax=Lutispora sp. TaxID=2828727 RepID=UPI002B2178A6|nr:class I SAM-dependent methyltransferase [Lutispora sp.]MEA4961057.1 class I SAM-dependent methyltransferase [Lutispora sp.]